ncbi:hypothetical protein SYYB1_4 [Bacillus phage vB_BaeroP_SYYB1]|uniref:Uncharacterized protein n=1 Tax=Bacillus phage vB_BaeroP_SYYB1 TaxID=2980552 RepID=A0A977SNY7_9CAUD|nr:hypothetical protein SYYB1_4 [Bacillus phage vB_BaeroP_SYYB1]
MLVNIFIVCYNKVRKGGVNMLFNIIVTALEVIILFSFIAGIVVMCQILKLLKDNERENTKDQIIENWVDHVRRRR